MPGFQSFSFFASLFISEGLIEKHVGGSVQVLESSPWDTASQTSTLSNDALTSNFVLAKLATSSIRVEREERMRFSTSTRG